jgi:hypothetical protein
MSEGAMTRKTYFTVLIAGIVVLWAALAISPNDRSDWLLENVLRAACCRSRASRTR